MATRTNQSKQLIVDAFASADDRMAHIREHSISTAISNSFAVVAITTELAINELASFHEDQLIERAKRRAEMLS